MTLNIWPYFSVSVEAKFSPFHRIDISISLINHDALADDDKCESCPGILEELETIDDDTDDHNIQFVKSNDVKLAHEIGIFSFPALVYYETGVPIMYDGEYSFLSQIEKSNSIRFDSIQT